MLGCCPRSGSKLYLFLHTPLVCKPTTFVLCYSKRFDVITLRRRCTVIVSESISINGLFFEALSFLKSGPRTCAPVRPQPTLACPCGGQSVVINRHRQQGDLLFLRGGIEGRRGVPDTPAHIHHYLLYQSPPAIREQLMWPGLD